MMRLLALGALLLATPAFLAADLLPEALGAFTRESLEPHAPEDAELYEEFGLEEAEVAVYRTGSGSEARVVAEQFYDDTGAFSAFRWEQEGEGFYSGYGERSWTNDDSTLIHFANYLVRISGDMPLDDHIELMLAFFPRVRPTPDPPILNFRPEDVRAGSEKHILGPVGLAKLAPEIPPSTAGFHFGSEAHFAEYDSPSGPQRMLLFSYPTPQMARVQADEFYKLGNVVAKRSGPIIAAVPAPASPDEAERLLAKVRYAAEVTLDESSVQQEPLTISDIVLDTFILVGILVGLCIVGGLFVAGARYLAGRVAPNSLFAAPEGDGMIHLDLDESDEKQRYRGSR